MKKNLLFITPILLAATITIVLACVKDPEISTPPPPAPQPTSLSLTEEFDSVGRLESRGWALVNNSEPVGRTGWKQGKYEMGGKYGGDVVGFTAHSANNAPTDYAAADITAAADPFGQPATISAWMITPELQVKNGDEISFYTKSQSSTPDRLQVRANYTDVSADVGNSAESVGQFTTLLLDINPALNGSAYPKNWTKYTITVAGLTAPQKARFAFRYYVTNGGNSGANSDMIGVDSFSFLSK